MLSVEFLTHTLAAFPEVLGNPTRAHSGTFTRYLVHLAAGALVTFLGHCQHRDGGFGGGPGQLAHLAPTYAAVGTLVTLGGEQALASVNRQAVASFIWQMAVRPGDGGLGGFTVCEGAPLLDTRLL